MTVDEAYDFCRKLTHKHGANFSVGFRFLPPQKKRAVYAAYAFCRYADDIVDESGEGGAVSGDVLSAPRSPLTALNDWQRELDAAYDDKPTHAITIALSDSLKYFPIPKDAFIALIDGCRQDLVKTRYETFEELLYYCELVASSISDISLAIFGYRSERAIDYGRDLATALQLTNVTRDVGDDLLRDRVYIPQEELRRFGVSESDLVARRDGDAMRSLIEFQIARAEDYFRRAEPLLKELSFDARFPTLLMGGVYATVLAKLREDPLMVIRKRLSLTPLQKVMVVGTRMIRPHFV